jgi:hypothetical protein
LEAKQLAIELKLHAPHAAGLATETPLKQLTKSSTTARHAGHTSMVFVQREISSGRLTVMPLSTMPQPFA